MAEKGEYPMEIKQGILVPLPKPGKKAGPPGHLRPIILLSMLRKILAICMLIRSLKKLLSKIPPSQAAYQQGRSSTKMVFSFKILAEKTIISDNWEIALLLLDMPKAFDTVKRKDLFNILKEVLDEDEIHMIKLLVEDVRLQVKVGKTTGTEIRTNIGVPQGDCLSPILFIIYLAEALKLIEHIEIPPRIRDHKYAKPQSVMIS